MSLVVPADTILTNSPKQQRRSHRKFTGEEVSADDVKTILRAGLMAPTSKGQRAWQFVVVDDKKTWRN